MSQHKSVIGVLGGSGVYEIDGLTNTKCVKVNSPFRTPSDELLFDELDGQQLVFLPGMVEIPYKPRLFGFS